ncbi:MAG: VWA domain-containing protein [Acidobacteriota bacterium]
MPRVASGPMRGGAVRITAEGALAEDASAGSADPDRDAATVAALAETDDILDTGEHVIQLGAMPEALLVGRVRVSARARGSAIARVAFALNGRTVMRKTRPPYSVELDLGPAPRLHTVRATALDADGNVLAEDALRLNAGPHRFAIRLLQPRGGRIYERSLNVRAALEVPEGETLDRVELYYNDLRIATLYQPPYEQPVLLDRLDDAPGAVAYVRAAAYLKDGNRTEDVVLINTPDAIEQVDVGLVELYTSVLDRKKRFVPDLGPEVFTVREDGAPQEIVRFEPVDNVPVHAVLILDTSLSMLTRLPDVERAADRFLRTVLRPRDRAALMTFADVPRLAVRFTNQVEVLAGGLSGLAAEGETALYDALLEGLHYTSGLRGRRALIVLTDGEDSRSRHSYDDVLDFARHTGATVYIIGLDLPTQSVDAQLRLRTLAVETGGSFFSIRSAAELRRIYATIEAELRAQYLLAYQPSRPVDSVEGFRRVEVEVEGRGLEAKTRTGYVP